MDILLVLPLVRVNGGMNGLKLVRPPKVEVPPQLRGTVTWGPGVEGIHEDNLAAVCIYTYYIEFPSADFFILVDFKLCIVCSFGAHNYYNY